MHTNKRGLARAAAFAVLAASLAGLWQALPENTEVRLGGEELTSLARDHPPKPWRGFQMKILSISVDRQVRMTAHVSGYRIHTPVEITGEPEYDPERRALYFHVSKVRLPDEAKRPIFRRLNNMLNPVATYIVGHVMNVIPVRRFKSSSRGGFVFLTTVKSVQVEGDALVVRLHSFRVASAAIALAACAFIAAWQLIAALWRRWRRAPDAGDLSGQSGKAPRPRSPTPMRWPSSVSTPASRPVQPRAGAPDDP